MARTFHWADPATEDQLIGKCRGCGRTKTLNMFAKDSHRPSGRRSRCAACRTDYDQKRRYVVRCFKYGFLPIIVDFTSQQLIDRYGDHCFYCAEGSFETYDHVLCVRLGGPHTLSNVRPSCLACNRTKLFAIDLPAILDQRHGRRRPWS